MNFVPLSNWRSTYKCSSFSRLYDEQLLKTAFQIGFWNCFAMKLELLEMSLMRIGIRENGNQNRFNGESSIVLEKLRSISNKAALSNAVLVRIDKVHLTSIYS